jgi:hypothetical protein
LTPPVRVSWATPGYGQRHADLFAREDVPDFVAFLLGDGVRWMVVAEARHIPFHRYTKD